MNIRTDQWLRRSWPTCPVAVRHIIESEVIPRVHLNPRPCATDEILREARSWPWYETASQLDRGRFHRLVGHVVLGERDDYVVARTLIGNPRRLKAEAGPHKDFTLQVPSEHGFIGPFHVVEIDNQLTVRAFPVLLERSDPCGDLLIVNIGRLRRRRAEIRPNWLNAAAGRTEGEVCLRGDVVYDCRARRFVVRAAPRLNRPEFLRLIKVRFEIDAELDFVADDDQL